MTADAFERLWPQLRPAAKGAASACGFPWSAARNLTRGVAEYIYRAGWRDARQAVPLEEASPGSATETLERTIPSDAGATPAPGPTISPQVLELAAELVEREDDPAPLTPDQLVEKLVELVETLQAKVFTLTTKKRPSEIEARWARERLVIRIHEAEIQLGWAEDYDSTDEHAAKIGCGLTPRPGEPVYAWKHLDEGDLLRLAESMEKLAACLPLGPAPGAPAETAQDPSEPPTAKAAADSSPPGPRSCEICQEPLTDPGQAHKKCVRKAIKSRHRPTTRQWAALESILNATGQPHPAVVADLIGLGFVQRLESGAPRLTPRGGTLLRYRAELEAR